MEICGEAEGKGCGHRVMEIVFGISLGIQHCYNR